MMCQNSKTVYGAQMKLKRYRGQQAQDLKKRCYGGAVVSTAASY